MYRLKIPLQPQLFECEEILQEIPEEMAKRIGQEIIGHVLQVAIRQSDWKTGHKIGEILLKGALYTLESDSADLKMPMMALMCDEFRAKIETAANMLRSNEQLTFYKVLNAKLSEARNNWQAIYRTRQESTRK